MNARPAAALAVLLLASVAVAGPSYGVELREVGPNKILVVKMVREITGMGLKDANDLLEAVPAKVIARIDLPSAQAIAEKLQTTGATVAIVDFDGRPFAPPPPVMSQARSTVTLLTVGPKRIQLIKLVHDVTGLGVGAARDLVDRAPSVVKRGLQPADAEALAKQIRALGGTAKVAGDTL